MTRRVSVKPSVPPSSMWWMVLIAIVASVKPVPAQRYSADEAPIVTGDIARFWEAWDHLTESETREDSLEALTRYYYEPRSEGLDDFFRARITSVEHLLAVIQRHPRYYASIRESTLHVNEFVPRVREVFKRWSELVPDARFPEVYFVVGRMSSGGTTSANRILIGVEMYGRTNATPDQELGRWHREVIRSTDVVLEIVAHELIHTQQRYASDDRLLARVLQEGVPDFLGELIVGGHINGVAHAFAEPRAADLWKDFQRDMYVENDAGWLYTNRREGEPNDLGYWVGYRIAKAYYDRASDKVGAIRDMLTIQDYDDFVEESGIAQLLGTD